MKTPIYKLSPKDRKDTKKVVCYGCGGKLEVVKIANQFCGQIKPSSYAEHRVCKNSICSVMEWGVSKDDYDRARKFVIENNWSDYGRNNVDWFETKSKLNEYHVACNTRNFLRFVNKIKKAGF